MNNRLSTFFNRWASRTEQERLLEAFGDIADALSCQLYNTAGLVIKAGASALVKTGAAACHGIVKGVPFTIAAATDMPALAGTVVNATFNVYVFDQDSAGTRTTTMGTAGATYAAVVFPKKAREKTRIGYVIINPTGTGNFVGGTTALDDATVVPNAVYVNLIGASDPSFVR